MWGEGDFGAGAGKIGRETGGCPETGRGMDVSLPGQAILSRFKAVSGSDGTNGRP